MSLLSTLKNSSVLGVKMLDQNPNRGSEYCCVDRTTEDLKIPSFLSLCFLSKLDSNLDCNFKAQSMPNTLFLHCVSCPDCTPSKRDPNCPA